jgi:hypothetical protein
MNPTFTQLNNGWNAEPNAPDPQAAWNGDSLVLRFRMNAFQFPEYDEDDIGELVFEDCTRYRIGTVNDEGWYRDQGRFGRKGHRWGEFYEITGGLSPAITPDDWVVRCQDDEADRHYLFYFRDEDFECVARSWTLRITKAQQTAPRNR